MGPLTTVITHSGARYEIDETHASDDRAVLVRRLAPLDGHDTVGDAWPDGTTLLANAVGLVNLGDGVSLLISTDRGPVRTSRIVSLTDGVSGWDA